MITASVAGRMTRNGRVDDSFGWTQARMVKNPIIWESSLFLGSQGSQFLPVSLTEHIWLDRCRASL
jgi:hypothetical protein